MEIKRLYNKETKFMMLRMALFTGITLFAILGVVFLVPNSTSSIEDSLVTKDYEKLYSIIDKPDFSKEIFKAYMDYNLGETIEVLDVLKEGKNLTFRVKGIQGEKNFKFTKIKGNYVWIFDDYIYDWEIKLPQDAKIYIGNEEFKNEDGRATIKKIPFGVYEVRVQGRNYKAYTEKILAGQNFTVRLEPSNEFIEMCKGYLTDYFKFRESLINEGKPIDIPFVDKNSGVYNEVIAEAEMVKSDDIKVTKKIVSFEVDKFYFDEKMNVSLEVSESWNVEITNLGQPSMKPEEYKNGYTFTFKEPIRLVQIKTLK